MFMQSYFPYWLLLFLTSHRALSVYSLCASTGAALIFDYFCLPGSSGNSNKHMAARASGLIRQPALLTDNLAFICFMLIPCKDSSRKSQSSWTVLKFECVMSFVAMSLCVVGPTRTSWPPWPTWASGCYRNPRTTGKRKGQLNYGYLWCRLSAWVFGVLQKGNALACSAPWWVNKVLNNMHVVN